MTNETDRDLFAALRTMWDARDPMPDDLIDNSIVAIESDSLAAEFELLTMTYADRELLGTRGPADTQASPTVIEFNSDDFSVVVRVSALEGGERRLDGWTAPPAVGTVRIPGPDGESTVPIDENGRFEIESCPPGPIRLWFDRQDGLHSTPSFDI